MDAWIDELWEIRGGLALGDKLIRASVVTALKASGLYDRGCKNALQPVVRERELCIPHSLNHLDGFRIIHLADPHFDKDAQNLAPTLRLLSELEGDIAVFTGDCFYEHDTPESVVVDSLRAMCEAVRCNGPIYACLGNNDPYTIIEATEHLNIEWLINRGTSIEHGEDSVWIGGVDDPHKYRCHDIGAAMDGAQENNLRILLAHTPEIDRAAEEHGAHIYLCGHTHGGQLCLPGGFAPYRNGKCRRDQVVGRWKWREMSGHTSAGLGCTAVPVRFNRPPELVRLTLRATT